MAYRIAVKELELNYFNDEVQLRTRYLEYIPGPVYSQAGAGLSKLLTSATYGGQEPREPNTAEFRNIP